LQAWKDSLAQIQDGDSGVGKNGFYHVLSFSQQGM
jgi:hypothetical protein